MLQNGNVTREDQDNFALSSQTRAATASKPTFADQIVPVEIQTKGTLFLTA